MSWELKVLFDNEHSDYGKWHSFPTTAQKLQELVYELGGDGTSYDIVQSTYGSISLTYDIKETKNFNEINYLAVKLAELNGDSNNLFCAIVESGGKASSAGELINIIENLDCFYLQPVHSKEDYGEFQVYTARDRFSALLKRLEGSSDPTEREFVKYLDDLEEFVDKQRFGHAISFDEKGKFTDYGYITQTSELQNIYKGVEDIPEEYRVFEPHKYMRLENTDLSVLLTKIHALGGDRFFQDLQYNLNKLGSKASAHYLMLMTKNSIHITEAAHAYRKDSDANNIWEGTADSQEVKAFYLYVTDNQEAIIGDLTEISFSAQKRDIADNCIYLSSVTAVGRDGNEKIFSAQQWDSMQLIEKDSYPKRTRHFEPEHLQAVLRHLDERDSMNHHNSYCVDEGDFLSDLNNPYMAESQNPQPDFMRVSRSAANDILLQSVVGVYRLLPDGPEKLRLMDSVKSSGLNYTDYCEFAIKKNALEDFGRWAKIKTDALSNPRREHKPKAKEPEL